MATDALEDEELRFCFNIDVTEDEFYQNLNPKVNTFFLAPTGAQGVKMSVRPCVRPSVRHIPQENIENEF